MNTSMTAAQSAQQGNRNPDGTYGFGTHSEPEVRLFDTHRGGTFFHPTPPSSARVCVDFWSSVDAPDDAIDRFARSIKVAQAQQVSDAMTARLATWGQAWVAANPQPSRQKDIDSWTAAYQIEHSIQLDRLQRMSDEELVPGIAHKFDMSQLARIAQMVVYGPDSRRFPDEHQMLMETRVELFSGELTVREAWNRHDLGAHQAQLEYRDSATDIVAGLREVQEQIIDNTLETTILRKEQTGW